MSIRIYTQKEFYTELKKHGFTDTLDSTVASTVWYHPKTCTHYTIPNYSDDIPESILARYINAVTKKPINKQDPDCIDKRFAVYPKIAK